MLPMRTTPPFRADHVGSLLRPPVLLAARDDFAAGKIDAARLREIEDQAITDAVAMQAGVGLQSATDGEFRRATWHMDFIYQIGGISKAPGNISVKFHNQAGDIEWTPAALHVGSRLRMDKTIFGDDFSYLQSAVPAGVMAKQTIPSPNMVHYRGGPASIDPKVYPDIEEFWADLAAAYADEVTRLAALGCRYLQFDDTSLAYLNDPAQRAEIAARGEDADHMHLRYIRQVNAALADKPAGLTVTTHLCRGNFRSSWAASGGYDFVAEALFGELAVDGFFLEYDDPRSGGFEPLRFIPPGKMVVLGLVTTKTGALEDPDLLKRRIDQAAKYVPLDQLCPVRPVRFLLHRRGQRPDPRPAARQARAHRAGRPRRLGLIIPGRPARPRWRGGTWGRRRSSGAGSAPAPGVHRHHERAEHLAAARARRGGAGQHPRADVLDQLDEAVVARLVDPAPGGLRDLGRAHAHVQPLFPRLGSVSPTAPISGSVKVTRGTAWYCAAKPGSPRMSAMTIPAWYMDMWVNAPLPVMSPSAHTPGAARRWSSTGMARRLSSMPTAPTPTAARSVRRPVATSSASPVSSPPPSRVTVKPDRECRTPVARWPVRTVDALPAEHPGQQVPGLGLLQRQQPVRALDDGDPAAEPREDLAEFDADRAAAEHHQRAGYPLGLDRLVVGPERRARQARDRRHGRRGAGVDDDPAPRPQHLLALTTRPGGGHGDLAGRADPPVPADQDPALAGEPVRGHLVVPVVGGLVADPARHRRPVGGDRAPRPPCRGSGAPP